MTSLRPTLLLVTPAVAQANNGNWRTAARWAQLVAPAWQCIVQRPDEAVVGRRRDDASLMVALHAKRSRAAIAAWGTMAPRRPLIVVLTGTDLYRDIAQGDGEALASLNDADRLIVLQDDAVDRLPAACRPKARVVFQSARTLLPFAAKSPHRLDLIFVAHLRDEKDPATMLAAWRLLPQSLPATLTIVGAALDERLGADAAALAAADPRVQWLGARPHPWTRQAIKRAHVLVVPSRMEGGANVIAEALTSGTAVLATGVSGNLGMLGGDYGGYFPAGDAAALAKCIIALATDPGLLRTLAGQCARRAGRFAPDAERSALLAVFAEACIPSAIVPTVDPSAAPGAPAFMR